MAKSFIDSKIIVNWPDYYLVKWGIKKSAELFLKTKTDTMKLILSKDILHYRKGLFKAAFRLIKEDKLRYFAEQNEMVIYNKRLKYDFLAIETVEKLLNLNLTFELYDSTLFIVDIAEGIKILVRKNISDVDVAAETLIQNEYAVLKPYLKDAVVLDIGAYIGDSAIRFVLDGAKQVYAYEPHPALYSLALKNIELNNLGGKITLRNLGVNDKPASLTIQEDSPSGASASFGLSGDQECKNIKLKLVSLESIVREIGDISVMKMDCEGAEFKAILSCPIDTLRRIKAMVIEYHADPESLVSYLKKAGFETTVKNKVKKLGLLFAKLNKL